MAEKFPPLFGTYDFLATATINFGSNRFDLFAVGYQRAADILVEKITTELLSQDTLVYPIVFLYRHYLELRLKEIIRRGKDLLQEEGDFQQIHDLMKLWVAARSIMKKVWDEAPEAEEFRICHHVFSEFSKLDPVGETFRYPENTIGDNPLSEVHSIDLAHVRDYCGKVAGFLDGVSAGIGDYLDRRLDGVDRYS